MRRIVQRGATPAVLRLYDATEADRSYQRFDIIDPTLLVFLDNTATTLRGGISYSRDSTFSGEISAGRAFIDYADPSLTDGAGAWCSAAAASSSTTR